MHVSCRQLPALSCFSVMSGFVHTPVLVCNALQSAYGSHASLPMQFAHRTILFHTPACLELQTNSLQFAHCGADSDLSVTQRSTLDVTFSGLAVFGGSSTQNVMASAVTDLTFTDPKDDVAVGSLSLTEYGGFSYTPLAASYSACGTTGTNCTFSFFAIDLTTLSGSEAKACRFSMVVSIDPIALPTISSSQLYADYSGASMSAVKAPLALLALLAVPALFFLAL